MNLKEVVDTWVEMGDEKRKAAGAELINMLSPDSINALLKFQNEWDRNKPFDVFLQAQQQKIEFCVNMEIGFLGDAMRLGANLEPINWNTELAV